MEQKELNLARIRDMYYKYGVKNFTMDDVAQELGISKRTLYQMVPTKNELVAKVLEEGLERFEKEMDRMLHSTRGSIPKLYGMYQLFRSRTKSVTPVFVFSLGKSNPELATEIRKKYRDLMVRVVADIMEEGQNQGDFISAFKADFPRLIAGYIFQLGTWHLSQEEEEIDLKSAFCIQVGGICTEKGKKELNRFMESLKD